MQASNFGGTFNQLSFEFLMKFSQKMPLYFFYTMVQKKSKMTKNSNQRGGGGERGEIATRTTFLLTAPLFLLS